MQVLLPVIMAVFWAVRAANRKKSGSVAVSAGSHPAGTSITGQALLRGLGIALLPFIWLLLLTAAVSDPNLERIPPLAAALALTVLCFPVWVAPLCRKLPVSVGYYLTLSVGFNWARSHGVAGAVIVAARARRLNEREGDWLMTRLRNSPHCHALTWVAAGAVRANRGDVKVARLLFGIAARMTPMPGAEPARRLAREWLIAEAVQRGAWTEARSWAADGRGIHAYVTSLGSVVDVFATGRGAATAARTRSAHLRFGRASRLLAHRGAVPNARGLPTAWPDQLGRALALHARAREGRRVEDVQAACAAWDDVAGNAELGSWVRARADTLRAAADPLERLLGRSIAELAEVMWRERWFHTGTGTFGRVSDAAMDRAWPELKDRALAAYGLAETPERVLYAHDAFLAWEPLRVLAAAMIRDRPNDRGTIFQTMYSGSLHLAVVLYNKRGFRYFGNMVFRWLQMEGEGVMTDTLGGVLAGNIRSGI